GVVAAVGVDSQLLGGASIEMAASKYDPHRRLIASKYLGMLGALGKLAIHRQLAIHAGVSGSRRPTAPTKPAQLKVGTTAQS
ncbi:MAG: hypothetical protein U5N53_15400, partial [Mycobacterium sp.]|nr:hypothetical protein [Mycobacterium sp.]